MVSGHDIIDLEVPANGLWNNSAVLKSTVSAYHSSQTPHEQNSTGVPSSSSTTDSPLRTAPHATVHDVSAEIRSSPTRTPSIAINTTSAPQSLTPDDNSNNSAGMQIMGLITFANCDIGGRGLPQIGK